jgi:hypothetical protein
MISIGSPHIIDRDQKWARLEAARTTYEQPTTAYDKVLVEVTARISTTGSRYNLCSNGAGSTDWESRGRFAHSGASHDY